jgi:CRISPR-associated protein Cas1
MGAMTLLVDRRGAALELSSNGQTVLLRYPDGEEHRVGLYALRRIVVQGEAQLSSGLLRACAAAQVALVLSPGRGRGESVDVLPHAPAGVRLRLAQHRLYADEAARLALARRLVAGKLRAQADCLVRHGIIHDIAQAETGLREAQDVAAIMGVEGRAARGYFEKWRGLWDAAWGFHERNRRPPRDPVNVLLSLGYTLAGGNLGHRLAAYGLETGLGFLHVPHRTRPALALDLLEPVRPYVDEWLWQQAQKGLLTPANFTLEKDAGCRLDKDGRSAFYGAWFDEAEAWLDAPMRGSLAVLLSTLRQFIPKNFHEEQSDTD